MRVDKQQVRPVVFAGITLSHAEIRAALGTAEVRPPVRWGDLDQLDDGRIVSIIDGELHGAALLPADEIRRAIARGIDVRGASSLGALRAAELRHEGMRGIGWVYDAFCTGRIRGIDEIAVIYDPYSYRPLTVPLVNVRFCLDGLVSRRAITAGEAAVAMKALRSITLEERDPGTVVMRLTEIAGRRRISALLERIRGQQFDIKAMDAQLLLNDLSQAGRSDGVFYPASAATTHGCT